MPPNTRLRCREKQKEKTIAAAREDSVESKALYMFFAFPFGPVGQSLYGINMPDLFSISDPPQKPPKPCNGGVKHPKKIFPILEFCVEEYPWGMSCVELNNKLYFMGGETQPPLRKKTDLFPGYPRNVYILDCSVIPKTTFSARPSELLMSGTPMETGKPFCYAFVAYGKIYALSGRSLSAEPVLPFEVFDPVSNQWSTLPEPPTESVFSAHAIVKRKVFIATTEDDIYSFDLDNNGWKKLSEIIYRFSSFEFVEDILYASCYRTVAALGPPSKDEAVDLGLFDQIAYLSPDLDAIKHPLPGLSTSLAHMGNKIFCHVFAGSPADPKFHYLNDEERLNISITIFEALRDTYTGTMERGGGALTFFRANFLHSADFVGRSRCNANADGGIIKCCFVLSSIAPEIVESDDEQKCCCSLVPRIINA